MLRHIFLLSIRAMARAFFCSKVTGAPPFHDVNVTQLIVIDYYYHAVVMLSWDYDFKYRLLFWCISLCGMVLYPVAKWYIEDTALKFTRPDFWNSGFFTDTPGKMGLLAVYTGTVFILSLPLSMIYILSVIIKRLSVR